MILTGTQIIKEVQKGNINLVPFFAEQVNPNSYDYRLGRRIKIASKSRATGTKFKEIVIPEVGLKLKKGTVYLGHTNEIIGSDKYAMSLIGKSSLGRLGLFLQISANLGHTNSNHKWTLELYPLQDIVVYPKMIIGQVSFWTNKGSSLPYHGVYGNYNIPKESFLRSPKL